MSKPKEYAVYDTNDELMFVGTANQCAEYLGIGLMSFYSVKCKYDRGVTKKMKRLIIEIDEKDDEDGDSEIS